MAAKKVPVLQVTARSASFRRAGIQFGASPVNVPIKDLSKEQIQMIKSEPNLITVETEIEAGEEVVQS